MKLKRPADEGAFFDRPYNGSSAGSFVAPISASFKVERARASVARFAAAPTHKRKPVAGSLLEVAKAPGGVSRTPAVRARAAVRSASAIGIGSQRCKPVARF